jgi:ABC-2 type transport system ATP-binding protein
MLYDKLSPAEYLGFVAGLWRIAPDEAAPEAERLLRWLELWDQRDQRCEGFSRGMKQKVALAGALIHDPRLLILDEPLTGLDAAAARLVKDMLQERVDAGGTVILTTHILEVAERMADRIGIIAGGRLLAEGTLDALRGQAGEGRGNSSLEDVFLQLTASDAGGDAP